MSSNIFCENCRFYGNDPNFRYPSYKNTGTDRTTFCKCPKNINPNVNPKSPARYISTPSIINYNHNCGWFLTKSKYNSYTWSHKVCDDYEGGGDGTFSIDPVGGTEGFYIGKCNLKQILDEAISQGGGSSGEIVEEVEELNESVQTVIQNVENLNHDVQTITNNVQDVKNSVQSLNQNVQEIGNSVQNINNSVQEIDNAVTDMSVQVNSNTQQITAIRDNIEDVIESEIDEVFSNVVIDCGTSTKNN